MKINRTKGNYIITSKPGMAPFAVAWEAKEAFKLSSEARSIGLDGQIIIRMYTGPK